MKGSMLDRKSLEACKGLWQEVFGDSREYVDFYYEERGLKGDIYICKEEDLTAILHADHYKFWDSVHGRILPVRYIVGVATKEEHRHQGYMSRLLKEAVCESYRNREAFIYLMPVNTKIYEPFGFCCMNNGEKGEIRLKNDDRTAKNAVQQSLQFQAGETDKLYFHSASREEYSGICSLANTVLQGLNCDYIYRDEEYCRVLQKQMRAAGGDLVCLGSVAPKCQKTGRTPSLSIQHAVISFMAEEGQCEITEMIYDASLCPDRLVAGFAKWFQEEYHPPGAKECKIMIYHRAGLQDGIAGGQMMARITHMAAFLELLHAKEKTKLSFSYQDAWIEGISGYYEVEIDAFGGHIVNFEKEKNSKSPLYDSAGLWKRMASYMPQIYISDFT